MSDASPTCRLCSAPLRLNESRRGLCPVCDDYAQHIALHANRALDRIVGELQNHTVFRAASRRAH